MTTDTLAAGEEAVLAQQTVSVRGFPVGRVVRGAGWGLIVAGSIVLLYLVYLLWFTNLGTEQEQAGLAESFTAQMPTMAPPAQTPPPATDGEDVDEEPAEDPRADVDLGGAVAALWFERDGERIVADDLLFVVGDVTVDALKRGPGHYPQTGVPGGPGNHAIAGHRTTYGSPFWSLDELTDGDTIHVVDLDGREWVYAFAEQAIVAPSDVWVIGDDPRGTGEPTITLTTCHPRFSAAQRLIVWGELVDGPIAPTAPELVGHGEDTDDAEATGSRRR